MGASRSEETDGRSSSLCSVCWTLWVMFYVCPDKPGYTSPGATSQTMKCSTIKPLLWLLLIFEQNFIFTSCSLKPSTCFSDNMLSKHMNLKHTKRSKPDTVDMRASRRPLISPRTSLRCCRPRNPWCHVTLVSAALVLLFTILTLPLFLCSLRHLNVYIYSHFEV